MLFVHSGNHLHQHPVCSVKIKSIDSLQRQEHRRPLIHPFCAKRFLLHNCKSVKQLAAVFFHWKKAVEHAHSKRLSKTPRACDKCHFRWFFPQKFRNQSALVHIIISVFPYLLKIWDAHRNIHFCSSFPYARRSFSILLSYHDSFLFTTEKRS